MNTEMSKEEIYEYGKKLVDNSKSEKEIAFERNIKEQIIVNTETAKELYEDARLYERFAKEEITKEYKDYWKNEAK